MDTDTGALGACPQEWEWLGGSIEEKRGHMQYFKQLKKKRKQVKLHAINRKDS